MAQVINTNIMSINAQRNLSMSQKSMAVSLERLSSGLRINRAADDAAGLAVSENMTTQIRQQSMQIRNVNDGISFAQTGEAALQEAQNILQRMNELNTQKSNGTYSGTDTAQIDLELNSLQAEFNSQLSSTYNGVSTNGSISVEGITVGLSTTVSSLSGTGTAEVAAKINAVSTARATFGAQTNRLEAKARFLAANVESLSAARSRIRDADFAVETANLTRTQILQQAGVAMLAQANAMPQNALALLR